MIEVKNLNLFIDGNQILKKISFKTDLNLAVIGPSGSGKSSLFKAICNILDTRWNLRYEKLSLSHKPRFLFQDCVSCFFPYLKIKNQLKMIFDDLSFDSVFDELNIDKKALNLYPHELSRGMAQRIQIALNLAFNPKILVCDEITSSLDKKNTQNIEKILGDLPIQKVIIAHDVDMAARLCDDVLAIQNGKIVYFGDKKGYFDEFGG